MFVFDHVCVFQKKDQATLKFCSAVIVPFLALMTPFPLYKFSNKVACKVPIKYYKVLISERSTFLSFCFNFYSASNTF